MKTNQNTIKKAGTNAGQNKLISIYNNKSIGVKRIMSKNQNRGKCENEA